jgi:hypothetical protein
MTLQDVVEQYGAAWNEEEAEARHKLLDAAWADDGVYCDPMANLSGRDELSAHIGGFRSMMAGARLELTSGVDEHDGFLRFAWKVVGADGNDVMEGVDFGEVGPDGRIKRIVGFFGPPPAQS